MAILTYELPETYASISRPVALDIMKQLMDNLKIEQKVPIYYPGANGKMTTWNANNIRESDSAQFTAREKIIMNVRETHIEDDLLTLVPKQNNHPPIFIDRDSKIKVFPVYSRVKAIVTLTYRTQDRWQAESFRDNWRRKIAENREYMTFSARYKYPIPKVVVNILNLLYLTRSKTKKDFNKFEDYVYHFGSKKLTELTNAAGKGGTLAMAEIQEYIFGNFTDPNPPEIEKDELGAVWTTQLEFEYQYDKPISITTHYPIMINNHLVHEVLYPEVLFDIDRLPMIMSDIRNYYDNIQYDMGYMQAMRGPIIRIPAFDDWPNKFTHKETTKMVSVLLAIGEDTPRELFNLKDMGEYGLHPALHDGFSKNHFYLTKDREFPFYVQLYVDDVPAGDDRLECTTDLELVATADLDIYKTYHVVISVYRNLNLLTLEARKRFLNYPALVNAWLDIVLGHKPKNGYPKVVNGKVMPRDLERVFAENTNYKYSGGGSLHDPYLDKVSRTSVGGNPIYGSGKYDLDNWQKGSYNWYNFPVIPGAENVDILELGSALATVGIFTVTTNKNINGDKKWQ